MSPNDRKDHWLVRQETIRKLWIIFAAVLFLTVAVQPAFEHHAKFGIDGWQGFFAAYGFLACAVLIVVAKALGALLKRRDDYYEN